MTFKDFKEKMVKKNRNMSILIKIFDVNSDGPWYEEGRGLTRARLDRKYVHARIGDYLMEGAGARDFISEKWDIDEDRYLVAVAVLKGSRKEKRLKEYGFK